MKQICSKMNSVPLIHSNFLLHTIAILKYTIANSIGELKQNIYR